MTYDVEWKILKVSDKRIIRNDGCDWRKRNGNEANTEPRYKRRHEIGTLKKWCQGQHIIEVEQMSAIKADGKQRAT